MKKIFIGLVSSLIICSALSIITHQKISEPSTNSLTNKIYMPQQVTSASAIILPSTQIIYNYYYEEDGCIESTSETAPHFLIGMNENELRNTFKDWQIKDFSKEKVVMQKKITGPGDQHYIVGIKDGYVAVFYQKPINGSTLYEITNMPVNSLTAEDKKRLEAGIKISGEDKLISILQDYES